MSEPTQPGSRGFASLPPQRKHVLAQSGWRTLEVAPRSTSVRREAPVALQPARQPDAPAAPEQACRPG